MTPRSPLPAGGSQDAGGARLRELGQRRLLVLVLLSALLGCACLASIAVGTKHIPLAEVFSALVAPSREPSDTIVRSLRVPRTVLSLLIGVALGMAGGLMQGHTRNPLADPGILGVNAGAALGVVLAIYTLDITSLFGFIWFAFAGALAASVLVFVLGSLGGGGATPVTLALAGAAVSVLLFAMVQGLILLDQQSLDVYRFWAVGGVAGRGFGILLPVLPFVLSGVVLALAGAPGLNTLALGTDVARGLGQSIVRTRVVGVSAITLLGGGAVAAAGPIAFLGLVVPHVARYFTGPDYRWLLPYAALLGATLLLVADVVGRVVARPSELPVGIVLAFVGAPFFIVLVRRNRLATL